MFRNPILIFGLLLGTILIPFYASVAKPSKKPQVLVYGNSIAAYTAAIQSAKSGLNTVWVTGGETHELVPELFGQNINQIHSARLDAGIWRQLLLGSYKGTGTPDSILLKVKSSINPALLRNSLNEQLTGLPNLQIVYKQGIRKLTHSRKTWTLEMEDGTKWKVRTIIDASQRVELTALAQIASENRLNLGLQEMQRPENPAWAKTSVAAASLPALPELVIPLGQLVPQDSSNFYPIYSWQWIRDLQQQSGEEGLAAMANIGQSVGAIAGFSAFFKVNNNKLDVRQIQGELLQYGAILLPYLDVSISDPNWKAIQRTGLSGLFGDPFDETVAFADSGIYFNPDKTVRIEDISPALKQLYSRSQIWLVDNPSGILTMGQLLELIKQIAQKGTELEDQVKKAWTRKYQWEGELQLDSAVTKKQVAVLFDEFCKPFEIKVGFQGQVIR